MVEGLFTFFSHIKMQTLFSAHVPPEPLLLCLRISSTTPPSVLSSPRHCDCHSARSRMRDYTNVSGQIHTTGRVSWQPPRHLKAHGEWHSYICRNSIIQKFIRLIILGQLVLPLAELVRSVLCPLSIRRYPYGIFTACPAVLSFQACQRFSWSPIPDVFAFFCLFVPFKFQYVSFRLLTTY